MTNSNHRSEPLDVETLQELSVRAFQFLEQWRLPAGYERSCKITPGSISANRYLLGVELAALNDEKLDDLIDRLHMPTELATDLRTNISEANQLLIGFDGHVSQPVFKLYLEYWDRLRANRERLLVNRRGMRLHLGYKWRCLAPDDNVTTDYVWQPIITRQQVHDTINEMYKNHLDSRVFKAIGDVLDVAYKHNPNAEFIFLQVAEKGTTRDSFDLNLYPAGITVADIATPLQTVAAYLQAPDNQLQRIIALHADRPLGHISAGFDSRGDEYFTFYFDTEPQTG